MQRKGLLQLLEYLGARPRGYMEGGEGESETA